MSTPTEHLGLHQWEPEDAFLRTDFNEDFAKLDAAVGVAQNLLAGYNASGILTSSTGPIEIDVGFQPRFALIYCPYNLAFHLISPVGAVFLRRSDSNTYVAHLNASTHMSLTPNGLYIDKGAYYFSASENKPAFYIAFR